MRGDGDVPLPGANIKILEQISRDQRTILKNAHPDKKIEEIPQMWCMYKEVQGYFDDDGLEVPDDVTLLWYVVQKNQGDRIAGLILVDTSLSGPTIIGRIFAGFRRVRRGTGPVVQVRFTYC
jgi:hypothetical protein